MDIVIKKSKPKKSIVFNTYWEFAHKRQEVFFNKIKKKNVLTNDKILKKYKFTNAYRASDRVSQFLIQNVIYNKEYSPADLFFRIIIFKTFNKIETWKVLQNTMNDIRWGNYDFKLYDTILTNHMNKGNSIYSGAYIMTSGKSSFGYSKKHRNHLRLIELMMKDALHEKIQNATTLEDVFNQFKDYPTLGDFLAYQYTIDVNYSTLIDFSEMDFVMPGPGAKDGIKKCFVDLGDYQLNDVIKYTCNLQVSEFKRMNINFSDLWGRSLSLIDCQNLFCEVDKYSRVAHPNIKGISGRTRIKQKYNSNNEEINYWYPPKWSLNHKIEKMYEK
ncbi:nucleotide kinase domain-containing protein [Winogradskyella sp.]|uniref:nucleotide kinase domain-containing protein n=1 Tax=Winogradskyella sp. TaxID=1883156 RepID=UPI002616BF18|nr:nucleotide kinase domain-containing protein [Winogradskyella sp.]